MRFVGRRTHAALTGWGVWTLLAVLYASREALLRGEGLAGLERSLIWSLFDWYVLGVFTPLALWVARKARPGAQRIPLVLAIHAAGAALYTLLSVSTYYTLAQLVAMIRPLDASVAAYVSHGIPHMLIIAGPFDVVIYAGIVSVVYAWDYAKRFRERELKASQLEAQLALSQLQALRAQLHPHFLFNSLNAISALVHSSPDSAERMIARLAELLRHTLEMNGNQEVPLRQEVDLLEKYVDIQKTRFRDRLSVSLEIPEEARDVLVPNLILQPLVENAIRHGISPRASGGSVTVRAGLNGEELHLEVTDDGVGLPAERSNVKEGIGLANTRARLSRLYGGEDRMELRSGPEGGTSVDIRIPIKRERGEGVGVIEEEFHHDTRTRH